MKDLDLEFEIIGYRIVIIILFAILMLSMVHDPDRLTIKNCMLLTGLQPPIKE